MGLFRKGGVQSTIILLNSFAVLFHKHQTAAVLIAGFVSGNEFCETRCRLKLREVQSGEGRCPYCHGTLQDDSQTACCTCRTMHHSDCLVEYGCATYGCLSGLGHASNICPGCKRVPTVTSGCLECGKWGCIDCYRSGSLELCPCLAGWRARGDQRNRLRYLMNITPLIVCAVVAALALFVWVCAVLSDTGIITIDCDTLSHGVAVSLLIFIAAQTLFCAITNRVIRRMGEP